MRGGSYDRQVRGIYLVCTLLARLHIAALWLRGLGLGMCLLCGIL